LEKALSLGKTGKRPEKGRTGKRANEIECPEKGKSKAPDLKSEASPEVLLTLVALRLWSGRMVDVRRERRPLASSVQHEQTSDV